MVNRLGNVIYWLSVLLAGTVVVVVVAATAYGRLAGQHDPGLALIALGFAGVCFGAGWSIRYILTGKVEWHG